MCTQKEINLMNINTSLHACIIMLPTWNFYLGTGVLRPSVVVRSLNRTVLMCVENIETEANAGNLGGGGGGGGQ